MTANQLTNQIIKYCTLQGHYVNRINNIPAYKHRSGTLTRGVADILGCTKTGRALAIEIKTENDRQSSFQKEFENHYKKRGGIYILARSLENVIEAGL